MKKILRFLTLVGVGGFLLLMRPLITQAQVSTSNAKGNYKVQYNSTTCKYEAIVTLTSGSLVTQYERQSYSSQFTVVLPASSPLGNLPNLTTVNPPNSSWYVASTIDHPAADPTHNFKSIGLNGGGDYPALQTGDTLVLFTFTVPSYCGGNIRPMIIGTDPTSDQFVAAGDPGSDISNAWQTDFTNRYVTNNAANTQPASPIFTSMVPVCTVTSFGLNLTANPATACAGPLAYAWTGPSNFSATTQNFTINNPTPVNNGAYIIKMTDVNGCITKDTGTYNTATCTVLPVRLSSFTAIASDCSVKLNWHSETEINTLKFNVQVSNGVNAYKTIGTVAANGSGNTYSFKDSSSQQGTYFYRLEVLDKDGSATYSTVVLAKINCGLPDVSVYPNPTTEIVTLSNLSLNSIVRVTDITGKQLTQVTAVSNSLQIDMSKYLPGTYLFIVVDTNQVMKNFKVVKK